MIYGLTIWRSLPKTKDASKGTAEKLAVIRLRMVAGAYKATPIQASHAEIMIPSTQDYLDQQQAKTQSQLRIGAIASSGTSIFSSIQEVERTDGHPPSRRESQRRRYPFVSLLGRRRRKSTRIGLRNPHDRDPTFAQTASLSDNERPNTDTDLAKAPAESSLATQILIWENKGFCTALASTARSGFTTVAGPLR